MKRIEFLAPVEAMRGNLSGKQNLKYAQNDNPAWKAPEGVQYARNYQPRYIGSKVAKTGNKHFSVRTKNAVNMTEPMRVANAVLAVSSAIADLITRNVSLNASLLTMFKRSGYYAEGWTFKKWLIQVLKAGLKDKTHFFFALAGLQTIIVNNPFMKRTLEGGVSAGNLPFAILDKFWDQLAQNGIRFKVGSYVGIAFSGDSFDDLIGEYYNTLAISTTTVGEDDYLMMNAQYVKNGKDGTPVEEWRYAVPAEEIEPIGGDMEYALTSVVPPEE